MLSLLLCFSMQFSKRCQISFSKSVSHSWVSFCSSFFQSGSWLTNKVRMKQKSLWTLDSPCISSHQASQPHLWSSMFSSQSLQSQATALSFMSSCVEDSKQWPIFTLQTLPVLMLSLESLSFHFSFRPFCFNVGLYQLLCARYKDTGIKL